MVTKEDHSVEKTITEGLRKWRVVRAVAKACRPHDNSERCVTHIRTSFRIKLCRVVKDKVV